MTALVWFRRDLRVHDHPALVEATRRHDHVLALFVVDERLLRRAQAARNRRWYLAHAARQLALEIERRGGRLVIRRGAPERLVPALASEHKATAVYASQDYAPYGRRRDHEVGRALHAVGAEWRESPAVLTHAPEDLRTAAGGAPRTFSAFYRRFQALPRRQVLAPPRRITSPAVSASARGESESALAALEATPSADLQMLPEPGERAARRRLSRWLRHLKDYPDQREVPGRDGTSGLSADMRLGLLSPVEVLERVERLGGTGTAEYARQLAWRDFYALQLLADSRFATRSARAAFEELPWREDPAALAAWQEGQTGFPLVDAGMRQLHRSGWMHNRVRMVTASFLTKHLLIDWRLGAEHFFNELVDGDLASNAGGWQWAASSGPDAQPYFRVFSPARQGARFDPDGEYVKRWVPELSRVPTNKIHQPWKMTRIEQQESGCELGTDYPEPIVEHSFARARALEAFRDAASAARAATER